jgi:hypothetical protein
MGFPLRSNIFQADEHEQQYFDRFPIQVAVLFSPNDPVFSPVFRDIFLHLDQITGDEVAFFAALDPPDDWREAARGRVWWERYRGRFGELGFSFEERPLVNEIARRFGLQWDELPALVISTNLWAAEFVTTPTSAGNIEAQLTALTQLAHDWGRPTTAQLITLLEDMLGAEPRYHPADDRLRYRFNQFYGVLETYHAEAGFDRERYGQYVRREMRQIELKTNVLDRGRARDSGDDLQEPGNSEPFGALADEVTGNLIAVATVAERAFEGLTNYRDIPLADLLDEESVVMLETSLTVGRFLEWSADDRLAGVEPLRFDRVRRGGRGNGGNWFDFTPGAQGVWKSLEREINLSVIQAARHARGIEMPAFFATFRPGFQGDCRVFTGRVRGRDVNRNLNSKDSRHKPCHEFFTLGDSWHIVDAMLTRTEEQLESVIHGILHGPLPGNFMSNWHDVYQIRNKASHRSPLSRREYEATYHLALGSGLLPPLMQLKAALRG